MQNKYALENQQSNGNSTMCRCIAFLTENGYFNPTMFMVECVDTSALSPIECIGRSWSRASTKAKGGQPSGGAGYKKSFNVLELSLQNKLWPNFCRFNVKPGNISRLHHSIGTTWKAAPFADIKVEHGATKALGECKRLICQSSTAYVLFEWDDGGGGGGGGGPIWNSDSVVNPQKKLRPTVSGLEQAWVGWNSKSQMRSIETRCLDGMKQKFCKPGE